MIYPNPRIFREYDIRGNADRDLTDPVIFSIGKAFASILKEQGGKTIAFGRDIRLSSPRISKTLIEAFLASGLRILDIGTVPTPLLYYSLFNLPVDGGIMVTGSHNPAPDNGIKLAIGKETIYGNRIQEIQKRILAQQTTNGQPGAKGELKDSPVREQYIQELVRDFGILPPFQGRPLRVVLDCGNGTAGLVAGDLYRGVGVDLSVLFEDTDGRFPNHHPDPTLPENLESLILEVKKKGADIGIAFDGDTDRIGVVTESGEILFGDQLLMLFSRQVLAEKPGSVILSEVKASKVLYDQIRERGGQPLMWKAGHSLIKAKMKETGAPLAGEMSGHIFFADRYYGYDDALYAGIRLLEIMANTQTSLSGLMASIPKTSSTPEIRRDAPDALKFQIVEALKPLLVEKQYPFLDIDGVRVEFPDGWGLVRASNTQPALVLRFEGPTLERRNEIQNAIESLLLQAEASVRKTP
ncbi:MAG: phosphomannomutase/phosphoglucomutase [Leptospirales bacterium]